MNVAEALIAVKQLIDYQQILQMSKRQGHQPTYRKEDPPLPTNFPEVFLNIKRYFSENKKYTGIIEMADGDNC